MAFTPASCLPSELVLPFQTADTLLLDEPATRALRERLELHLLAIQVLRGQGRDHSEAWQIVSLLTDDKLRAIVRGPPRAATNRPRVLPIAREPGNQPRRP